jgi:hypothetical protein
MAQTKEEKEAADRAAADQKARDEEKARQEKARASAPAEPEPEYRHDETVPGGRFGIASHAFRDGRRVETIRYVDAHGKPLDGGKPLTDAPSELPPDA